MQSLNKPSRGRRGGSCAPSDDIEKQIHSGKCDVEVTQTPVEDHPAGYPRFLALIAAHENFQIYRRFSTLRTRLILSKQDSLSVLENKLEKMDRSEKCKAFLGSRRRDRNQERHNTLAQIESELAGYDELVERNARIARFTQAQRRDIDSLRNWVDGSGCIAREESKYLGLEKDLFTTSSLDDDSLSRLEQSVEDAFVRFFQTFYRRQAPQDPSRDEHVSIPSGFLAKRVARASMAAVVTTVLLLPMLACNFLPIFTARVAIIAMSVMILISMMSGFTKARSIEVLVASATYSIALTVFITNGS